MAEVETAVKEKIGYITLNRPDKMNAITPSSLDEFRAALKEFKENPDVLVIIVSGKGRAFCTGADVVEVGKLTRVGKKLDSSSLYLDIRNMPKPMIAAIHGHCLAQGLGIALDCDIRIVAEGTKFGWPQVRRGISSTSGPTLAPHYLPLPIALELLFTGEMIDAQEAYRLFLVNRVVPYEQLMPAAEEMARKILVCAPSAVRGIKEAALRGLAMPFEERLRFSVNVADLVKHTEDAREGLAAFAEKRQPVWKGK